MERGSGVALLYQTMEIITRFIISSFETLLPVELLPQEYWVEKMLVELLNSMLHSQTEIPKCCLMVCEAVLEEAIIHLIAPIEHLFGGPFGRLVVRVYPLP